MSSITKHVFTTSVSDKFGDSGLTLVCIVFIDKNNAHATIDSLLMSCRIIGRNIEFVFIDQVFQFLKSVGVKNIDSKFIKTVKNNQVSNFYDKLGFSINKYEHNQKEK